MTRRQIALAALGAVMAAVLIGSAAAHQARLAAGRDILVNSEAVDPRALLTGHFARLALQPAAIDVPAAATSALKPNARAFVTLEPAGAPGDWRATAISAQKPQTGPGAIAVAVRVTSILPQEPESSGMARVDFAWGPDRIYLDQTEALAVEDAARRTDNASTGAAPRVRAILSLADDGGTLIKGVEIDGRRIETRW
jgi:hypothetical protein